MNTINWEKWQEQIIGKSNLILKNLWFFILKANSKLICFFACQISIWTRKIQQSNGEKERRRQLTSFEQCQRWLNPRTYLILNNSNNHENDNANFIQHWLHRWFMIDFRIFILYPINSHIFIMLVWIELSVDLNLWWIICSLVLHSIIFFIVIKKVVFRK